MTLDAFEKKHDYLVCIDSDGCAMDTMNIKHLKCFGPCMIEEWHLEEYREDILKRWNLLSGEQKKKLIEVMDEMLKN